MRFSIPLMLSIAALFSLISAESFTQPILWQDLADADLIRVDDTFYYSASAMHFSPGAPILRSYDLVNWEYFSHSVPSLDFNDARFDLDGSSVYNQGIYASTLKYHESRETFYWVGCMQGIGKTYIYTASDIQGPWNQTSIINDYCYYDDGTMYVAYDRWMPDGKDAQIWVAELSDDLQHKNHSVVWQTTPEIDYAEGCRFHKINGSYYIFLSNPGVGDGLRRDHSALMTGTVLKNNGNPVPGAGQPYQGAVIDTPAGDWWYIAFVNRFPGERIPVLAPLTWDSNGWPNVEFVDGDKWGSSYEYPLPKRPVKPITGIDRFEDDALGPQYEWNHNPDNSKWSVGQGLQLQTATVTDDFFMAWNTLSHRILGPNSTATIQLDYSSMADGDNAGLVVFRYDAA